MSTSFPCHSLKPPGKNENLNLQLSQNIRLGAEDYWAERGQTKETKIGQRQVDVMYETYSLIRMKEKDDFGTQFKTIQSKCAEIAQCKISNKEGLTNS